MGLSIDIAVEHDAWHGLGDLAALSERAAAAALAESGLPVPEGAELSIVLADDRFVQDLNARWRGKNSPTNVLSFPTDEFTQGAALGDIVVAFETCAREAGEHERPLGDYLQHLLVHGLLHLLGFDHETDDEAEAMEALESRTLRALGIASPYEDAVPPREAAGARR